MNGTWRIRAPVASKIAFAIAGATIVMDVSPAPFAAASTWLISTVSIVGTGSYVPEKILTNDDLSKMVDTSDEWITTRTGIKERRVAAKDENTSDMAAKAAVRALEQAKISAKEIDLIIVATATPDMLFPATACRPG